MPGVDICLNLLQATALANEVNLAKNLATTSVNLNSSNTVKIQDINLKLNTLIYKLQSLCSKLEQAKTSGIASQNYSYNNL